MQPFWVSTVLGWGTDFCLFECNSRSTSATVTLNPLHSGAAHRLHHTGRCFPLGLIGDTAVAEVQHLLPDLHSADPHINDVHKTILHKHICRAIKAEYKAVLPYVDLGYTLVDPLAIAPYFPWCLVGAGAGVGGIGGEDTCLQ